MTASEKREAAPSLCWNCHEELDSLYRCIRCVKIQPWPNAADYFSFLGLPTRLRIDLADLEERFLKLSRIFHPDFFQDSETDEREISLVNAARLNKAYNTLKDPAARAGYILELQIGGRRKPSKTVPPQIAGEIMELQELLAEYTAHDSGNPQRAKLQSDLEERHRRINDQYNQTLSELDAQFGEFDHVMDDATSPFEPQVRKKRDVVLARIDQTLAARLYLKRITDNIAATLEGKDVNPL